MSRGWRRTRNAISVIGALALLVHASPVVSSCVGTPEASSPRARIVRPPTVDADLELARRYAPIVYHATARRGGRQDLPCNVDFDGDLVGNNDWENFDLYEVTPTLLYAVLSTETHWFLTYHLFHPRDWAPIPLGLQDTHENDGENLQVVVDRSTGRVVLLFTQARYRGRIYANDRESFGDGHVKFRGGFRLADALGREDDDGTHACVFLESHGHGIDNSDSARGSITRTASMAGRIGVQGLGSYDASKHAVVGLTKPAAREYRPLGIRVNAVCPGVIKTPMPAGLSDPPGIEEALAQIHALKRLGEPREAAAAESFLAGDEASFITGQAIAVDGGASAGIPVAPSFAS